MPITGSDKALMYCQSNVERCGASRTGYHSPKLFVSVGGEHRATGKATESHKIEDLSITETRSSSPNRASFEAMGWEPTTGMEVIAQLGSKNHSRRLFAGTIVSVNETNIGLIRKFTVECSDWNWLLDLQPVYGHFTGTADEIALELMSEFAPDSFTVLQVESGLETVTGGITFKGVKLSQALSRLAKRVGAVQFIDYNKDLYFRVTPPADWTNPTDITGSLGTLKKFNVVRDLSQIANRVPFEGGGSEAITEVPAGETILPLGIAPDWWYGDVGGVVISGPQQIAYIARVEGGGGSIVGPGAQPSSAPTVTPATGSGVTDGIHEVTVVHKTAAGRTLPSASVSVAVGSASAPSAAVTAGTPTTGAGLNAGTHRYYPVFRTAVGSTTAGPVSNSITATAQVAAPTNAPICGTSTTRPGAALDPNVVYGYAYSFWDGGTRETTLSPVDTVTTANVANVAGRVNIGGLSSIPAGFQLRWYRTEGGGSDYKLLPSGQAQGQFAEISDEHYIDVMGDATLGAAAPVANTTTKGVCEVTGIPVSTEPIVTHVDMYREFNSAGAATAKLAFSVENGVTSASDSTTNAGLGALVPTSNTAAAGQIAVSDIPIGETGTTDRELYMSPAGGGTRRLALTIANNTATTGTITMSDATLAGEIAEPTVNTSGLSQPVGQVNPGSTSIRVDGFSAFERDGGWAIIGNGQVVVRYAALHEGSLVGIPASGPGSITSAITYGSQITAAPALTDCGVVINSQTAQDTNVSRALRLATGTATDRLGMAVSAFASKPTNGVRLRLSRVGTVTGNIWITIQRGNIGPGGTVIATSALVDASTIGTEQLVTFTHDTLGSQGIARWIVLHGDYTRSDTDYIAWHGSATDPFGVGHSGFADEYDGTNINDASGVLVGFRYQILQPSVQPIVDTIRRGDEVNLFVTVEDTDAQAHLQVLLDADDPVVRECPPLQDRRVSRDEAIARATAFLSLRAYPGVRVGPYKSKDMNNRAGGIVSIAITSPAVLNDDFELQSVTISNFTPALPPDYIVEASGELFSIEDLLAKDPT